MSAVRLLDLPQRPVEALSDAWGAVQDMHLRAQREPRLWDDPEFRGRFERTHQRFATLFERAGA